MSPDPFKIELDWRAYFEAFCSAHGGEPVQEGGRLLFRDGWQHSATDYRGPEWGPTDAADAKLKRELYWRTRGSRLGAQRAELAHEVEQMRILQLGRSASLQWRTRVYSEDGTAEVRVVPLDLDALRARLADLDEMLYECELELRALEAVCS